MKKIPTSVATPEQHKLLRKYGKLVEKRVSLMILGKDTRLVERQQEQAIKALGKLNFEYERIHLALYDFGYVK